MDVPLQGLSVLSLAVNVPGPVAAALLRDLGARVTKVEPPGGDPLAGVSPGWYADLVRGMEVLRLDLKQAEQRRALEPRLAAADLLLTATRPAALDRLGLGWDAIHARHPRLSVVAIVGYPAPRQDVAGHDLTYQAEQGLVSPPAMPRTLISDSERRPARGHRCAGAALRTGAHRSGCADRGIAVGKRAVLR